MLTSWDSNGAVALWDDESELWRSAILRLISSSSSEYAWDFIKKIEEIKKRITTTKLKSFLMGVIIITIFIYSYNQGEEIVGGRGRI
ncbi:MAG: hypothetical protein KBC00_00820 [Candidatus Levybacteria bacterium]|nr:hypothetical protein [Candidatus Levybacteria bacterium]